MRYTLYLPAFKAHLVEEELQSLASLFGGVTEVHGVGMWKDGDGEWITECVITFTYLTPHQWAEVRGRVAELERKIIAKSGEVVLLSTVDEDTNVRILETNVPR